jgi:hypothetical protein
MTSSHLLHGLPSDTFPRGFLTTNLVMQLCFLHLNHTKLYNVDTPMLLVQLIINAAILHCETQKKIRDKFMTLQTMEGYGKHRTYNTYHREPSVFSIKGFRFRP